MTAGKTESKTAREERLAAKLRENLKRRKSQARARASLQDTGASETTPSDSKTK
ncbi:hypothetical protein GCM10007989_29020 [Devosia pacifica]|uniref:Uncharacterized protein n=1 Tax=Devosia pacifica TaxID=1335967 RepID=A0A918S965_9HYPH|nr:hypothetical protein [Devosia pacifica]GHA31256.1 hypothetical protein GCM10007989_29020 [Devosia pacifica]